MNYYPDQIRAILVYIDALDAADKKVDEIKAEHLPYLKAVELTDPDGTDYGTLRDEVGGAWFWEPPKDERAAA